MLDSKEPQNQESQVAVHSPQILAAGQVVCNLLSKNVQVLNSGKKIDSLKKLSISKEAAANKLFALKQEIEDKKKELEKLEADFEKKKESYKCEEKLYHKITKTTFNLNPPPDTVSGYSAKGTVKTFELNEKENSQFFITNFLWSLLE